MTTIDTTFAPHWLRAKKDKIRIFGDMKRVERKWQEADAIVLAVRQLIIAIFVNRLLGRFRTDRRRNKSKQSFAFWVDGRELEATYSSYRFGYKQRRFWVEETLELVMMPGLQLSNQRANLDWFIFGVEQEINRRIARSGHEIVVKRALCKAKGFEKKSTIAFERKATFELDITVD